MDGRETSTKSEGVFRFRSRCIGPFKGVRRGSGWLLAGTFQKLARSENCWTRAWLSVAV
jgi:hypothetical protein